MIQQLIDKIELNAQAVTMDWGEDYAQLPKGYLDGELWAYDQVLMWIQELKRGE